MGSWALGLGQLHWWRRWFGSVVWCQCCFICRLSRWWEARWTCCQAVLCWLVQAWRFCCRSWSVWRPQRSRTSQVSWVHELWSLRTQISARFGWRIAHLAPQSRLASWIMKEQTAAKELPGWASPAPSPRSRYLLAHTASEQSYQASNHDTTPSQPSYSSWI